MWPHRTVLRSCFWIILCWPLDESLNGRWWCVKYWVLCIVVHWIHYPSYTLVAQTETAYTNRRAIAKAVWRFYSKNNRTLRIYVSLLSKQGAECHLPNEDTKRLLFHSRLQQLAISSRALYSFVTFQCSSQGTVETHECVCSYLTCRPTLYLKMFSNRFCCNFLWTYFVCF